MITIIVGIVVSHLSRLVCNNPNDQLDPDLFFPCVAKCIRKRRQCQTEMNGNFMSGGVYVFKDKCKNSVKNKEEINYL
jgi:hypothetical protein